MYNKKSNKKKTHNKPLNLNNIKIEKNIPMPKPKQSRKQFYKILEKMKPGNSIIIPFQSRAGFYEVARKSDKIITTRTIEGDSKKLRLWRVK